MQINSLNLHILTLVITFVPTKWHLDITYGSQDHLTVQRMIICGYRLTDKRTDTSSDQSQIVYKYNLAMIGMVKILSLSER